MKKLILIIYCLTQVICIAEDYEAEDFTAALLKSKTGAMIVYNGQNNSFTLDIKADTITPSDKPNFLIADNQILQSSIFPFQTKMDFSNLNEETQKKNMLGFMDYEMKYIKEQLKSEDLNEKYEFLFINNKLYLFWSYDMPKENKTVKQQCYLITISFDQMLILNSPVNNGVKLQQTKDFLVKIGYTLKLNKHKLDLNKLYYELLK